MIRNTKIAERLAQRVEEARRGRQLSSAFAATGEQPQAGALGKEVAWQRPTQERPPTWSPFWGRK